MPKWAAVIFSTTLPKARGFPSGDAQRKRRSQTGPDSRFLRARKGFTLGSTADLAVSEDHLIVEQRVTQHPTGHRSLAALVEAVEQRCGEGPQQVSADSGFLN